MSLYRLMARDRLKDGEVRPCDQPDIGDRPILADANPKHLREVRYESLDLIDQQLIALSVYLEEHQHLCASLNNLNGKIPSLGGVPLAMPEALAGGSLATVLAGRLDYLKSQGKISGP